MEYDFGSKNNAKDLNITLNKMFFYFYVYGRALCSIEYRVGLKNSGQKKG
jgi:hypothetical protein